jgi:hypothetical protein
MSRSALSQFSVPVPAITLPARHALIGASLAVLAAALLFSALAPVGLAIVSVFIFAGPHNWFEARFFLTQMPARWGPLRSYFMIGIGGVVVLSLMFVSIPIVGRALSMPFAYWTFAANVWLSMIVVWVAVLIHLRGRQKNSVTPARDFSFVYAIGLLAIAAMWMVPLPWELALVYLHPLIALVFLDRLIARRRSEWRGAYRTILCLVPIACALLYFVHREGAPLTGQDMLTMRIAQHSGAELVEFIPARALVAIHVFLELLHYGVWVVAIPLLVLGRRAITLSNIPLARRSKGFRVLVTALLMIGAVIVVALWGAFLVDYPLTRDVYFTIAIAHVLAEAPFLIRMI